MNTEGIPEGQGDLIRTWYQEMPRNPDEYCVMFRFSVIFNEFCRDNSNDVDHEKYLSDLRRQSTVDLFSNKASILHPNLFRMTYEALKHHGFDRTPASLRILATLATFSGWSILLMNWRQNVSPLLL